MKFSRLFPKWLRRKTVQTRQRLLREAIRRAGVEVAPTESRRNLVEEAKDNPGLKIAARPREISGQPSGLATPIPARPRLLILQLAHIGDFVLSLRAMQKLRDGFPGATVTLVCASWNAEWAQRTGLCDEVVVFDFFPPLNRDWIGTRDDIFARFERLDLGEYDIAVDLRHDADTRPCLYRVRAKARAGFVAPLGDFPPLDITLPAMERIALSNGQDHSLHAELRLDLLADAVVDAFAPRRAHPAARLRPPGAGAARRPYVVLAVGAGDPIRRWPTPNTIRLARDVIAKLDLDVVVVGGAAERDGAAEILAAVPARASAAVDLPLLSLAACLGEASAVVGLGSGVSHLAASLGTPTVVLLSGVSPLDVWRSVGPRVVNLNAETPCSPCGLKHESACPFGVVCLRDITPEIAFAALERLVSQRSEGLARAAG